MTPPHPSLSLRERDMGLHAAKPACSEKPPAWEHATCPEGDDQVEGHATPALPSRTPFGPRAPARRPSGMLCEGETAGVPPGFPGRTPGRCVARTVAGGARAACLYGFLADRQTRAGVPLRWPMERMGKGGFRKSSATRPFRPQMGMATRALCSGPGLHSPLILRSGYRVLLCTARPVAIMA